MLIPNDQVADYLEDLATRIRNGGITLRDDGVQLKTRVNYLSRPDEKDNDYRMEGSQTYTDLDDAAKRMHHGFSFFQQMVKATGILALQFDQTEEVKNKIKEIGVVEVPEWILERHQNYNLPDYMSEVGYKSVPHKEG